MHKISNSIMKISKDIISNSLSAMFNPIQAGGGGGGSTLCPLQVFPCCAKTVSSRLMKLSDL